LRKISKAKDYANLLLKFRYRSVAELQDKLTEKGFPESTVFELIEEYKRKGLLDDIKFAKMWTQDRMNLKPKGRLLVKQELKQKGLSEEAIEEGINDAGLELQEYELARDLAKKRMQQLNGVPKLKLRKRLYDYIVRRGFEYEVAAKAVKEVLE